jgi:hypothetical protein
VVATPRDEELRWEHPDGDGRGLAGRSAMRSPGRPPVARREDRQRFWAAIARGLSSEDAGREAGVSPAVGVRWFRQDGGMPSISLAPLSGHYLSFAEREEIALLRAQGAGCARSPGSGRWDGPARPTGALDRSSTATPGSASTPPPTCTTAEPSRSPSPVPGCWTPPTLPTQSGSSPSRPAAPPPGGGVDQQAPRPTAGASAISRLTCLTEVDRLRE